MCGWCGRGRAIESECKQKGLTARQRRERRNKRGGRGVCRVVDEIVILLRCVVLVRLMMYRAVVATCVAHAPPTNHPTNTPTTLDLFTQQHQSMMACGVTVVVRTKKKVLLKVLLAGDDAGASVAAAPACCWRTAASRSALPPAATAAATSRTPLLRQPSAPASAVPCP